MTAKTLALIVFDSTEAAWLLPVAASVAFNLDAHLTVLHPFSPVLYFDGFVAEPTFYSSIQSWDEEEAEKIRGMVEHQTNANGLQTEYRPQKDLYGAELFLLSSARGADLVILGSNRSPGRSPDDRGLVERLIRGVGRPVLVLDQTSKPVLPASRIIIGWSDTREFDARCARRADPGRARREDRAGDGAGPCPRGCAGSGCPRGPRLGIRPARVSGHRDRSERDGRGPGSGTGPSRTGRRCRPARDGRLRPFAALRFCHRRRHTRPAGDRRDPGAGFALILNTKRPTDEKDA